MACTSLRGDAVYTSDTPALERLALVSPNVLLERA
jgi:hypothetical protein